MRFYDRKKEIAVLEKLQENCRVAIIGRRRIGKTTLVEHFYKSDGVTFFIPAEKAEREIINDWVREHPEMHLPAVNTFLEFFEFVFFHFKDKVIFIDEIQNSLKVNKSFVFDLQRLMDKHKSHLKLVVTGSLISAMKKIIEKYGSPLYGRFDFIIKLRELNFKTVYEIGSDLKLNTEEIFKWYAVFGGIPKYYELIEKSKKIEFNEFVLNYFIRYPRPLYEEVRTMLKEEFGKEYKTFFSILSAISQGKNKQSEIAAYLGTKETKITKYVGMLKNDFELIGRKQPLIAGKRGVYFIKNNIVNFWFQYVWRYNELLETGQEKKVIEIIEKNLNRYVGQTFEKIIYEMAADGELTLPIQFTAIGTQWGKIKNKPEGKNSYEIDIVAVSEEKHEILFIECKWQDNVNAAKIAEELAEKAKEVNGFGIPQKEYYALFAKSFSKRINELNGKKVYCYDLEQLMKATGHT